MKKWISFSYFILAFICFLLLNLPFSSLEKMRGPFFGFEELFAKGASNSKDIEIAELRAESLILKSQIEEVKAYLTYEDNIAAMIKKCQLYEEKDNLEFTAFYKRRIDQLVDLLNITKWGISANVIYREPSSWSSAIWIDAGVNQNKLLKKEIIAVNSPVIIGDQLIGVIEKVDKNKSLVRLITDSRLTPSVRCVRGSEQQVFIQNHCIKLKELLSYQGGQDSTVLRESLDTYIKEQAKEGTSEFLAKGFTLGSSHPVWRARSFTLQGVGFNYDFGDEEGAPKSIHAETLVPLIQIGDALVTTGMDGVFPKGLLVAFVTEVSPMKEGAVSCELKAKIYLGEFSDLRKVTIIPPIKTL